MANLFLFSRKAFVMCYCFRAPIKAFFFDACRMTIKSCVLHLFPVPRNRKRPYNKHLISLDFSVRTVNYGSRAAGGIIGSFIHKFVCCCEWAKPVIQNHFSFKTCAIISVSYGKVNLLFRQNIWRENQASQPGKPLKQRTTGGSWCRFTSFITFAVSTAILLSCTVYSTFFLCV